MIVGDLSERQLQTKLQRVGLRIRLGPIVPAIRSPLPAVRQAISLLYAGHEVLDDQEFADFHVSVRPGAAFRRWVKPQAMFRFEDRSPFQPLPRDHAFALLEWGLNWSIAAHCHQYLAIHSAVVAREGRAMLLPAPPGSGKSTLCAALVARGWRLLSDELALIDMDSRLLVPMPRPISLKNQSIAAIADFWPQATMGKVIRDTSKGDVVYVRPPLADVQSACRYATPAFVVLPRYTLGEAPQLTPLGKGAAMMQLIDNAFNYSVHGRDGFEVLAEVVERCTCVRFTYGGDLEHAVQAFDALARK